MPWPNRGNGEAFVILHRSNLLDQETTTEHQIANPTGHEIAKQIAGQIESKIAGQTAELIVVKTIGKMIAVMIEEMTALVAPDGIITIIATIGGKTHAGRISVAVQSGIFCVLASACSIHHQSM